MKISKVYEMALKVGIVVTIAVIVALCFVANGMCGMWLVDVCFYACMVITGIELVLSIMCDKEKEEEEEEEEEP